LAPKLNVSIIIVNYKTPELLENCLSSLFTHTKGLSFEVIIVDNASNDGSAAMVRSRFPSVTLIESPTNIGFGQANNLGAAHASGDYLFLLNSDTVLFENALLPLLDFMRGNPHCGVCGGNLLDLALNPVHSYGPVLPSATSDLYRFLPDSMRYRFGRDWCYNYSGKPKRVGYITGADMMIRRDLFERVGGFDSSFFMYYEETELTARVRKLGFTVCSVPACRIIHIKGASLEFLSGARRTVYESKYRYLMKTAGRCEALLGFLIYDLWCLYKMSLCAFLLRQKAYRKYKHLRSVSAGTYYVEKKRK
jgi:GT2 family glycosyltransferase